MNADTAVDVAREAMMLALAVGAPVLATALIVAVVIGVLQAATQVQEHTLTFVPKLLAVLLAGTITGPWMLTRLVEYARRMFGTLPW